MEGKILGTHSNVENSIYKISGGRNAIMQGHSIAKSMGVNTWAAFAGSDDEAMVDGDFAL